MAENNSSAPLKTAEGEGLAIDIAEHTAEADAVCRNLYNQYGHEQTAKNAREWIQIAKQLLDEALQAVAAQEKRKSRAMGVIATPFSSLSSSSRSIRLAASSNETPSLNALFLIARLCHPLPYPTNGCPE